MKRFFFVFIFIIGLISTVSAQSFNQDQRVLQNYLERMYNNSPFEGCRYVDDYNHTYLISVVSLDKAKYTSSSVMNRVAAVKSMRQAGEFLNGTQSYSEFVIKTPRSEEKGGSSSVAETIDIIKTNSTGYVQQMQLFTTFDGPSNTKIFIFLK